MTIVMPLFLFVIGILLLLYVLKCGLYEPDVQEARIIQEHYINVLTCRGHATLRCSKVILFHCLFV